MKQRKVLFNIFQFLRGESSPPLSIGKCANSSKGGFTTPLLPF